MTRNDFNPLAFCRPQFSGGFPVIAGMPFDIYFAVLVKFPLLYELSYVYQIK